MGEVLSLAEIETRYPAEWVLVEDPELDKNLDVVRGKVVAHSSDRDRFNDAIKDLHPRSSAFLYTGPWPEGVEWLL